MGPSSLPQSCCSRCLFASPLRLTFVEEGIHAFAGNPGFDNTSGSGPRLRPASAARAAAPAWWHAASTVHDQDKSRQFIGPSFEGGDIFHDSWSDPMPSLPAAHQARGEDDLLEPRRPDQRREPADILSPTSNCRACAHRKAEFCGPGSDAQLAAGGDPGAAAGASAVDRCDRRHPALFERGQHAIDPDLVADRILGVLNARN